MSMNTIKCEEFIYEMEDFERDIMRWFSPQCMTAKIIKEHIDEQFDNKPKCFRNAVYKRILNFKNDKYWWIRDNLSSPFDKEQEREELLAIWKLGITHANQFYLSCYENQPQNEDEDEERPEILRAIDSWFFKKLTEYDTKLEKGEMNEQKYITACNNMKKHKKIMEDLLSACICSAMGRQNRSRIGEAKVAVDMFRIICMPCGFLN